MTNSPYHLDVRGFITRVQSEADRRVSCLELMEFGRAAVDRAVEATILAYSDASTP